VSLRPEAFWFAAVLACGGGAVLSHRSAAAAWDLRPDGRRRVDVTTAAAGGRAKRGIDAHQCQLSPADVTTHRGVPITTPARTLLDLAEVVSQRELDRALEEALRLRLTNRAAIERTLARAPGRRALKPLRASLDALEPLAPFTRSELERRTLALVKRHDLPQPLVNVRVAGLTVDLVWPSHHLVVEVDGYAYHHTPQAFERDRRRDATLRRRGYTVQRFTWRQVTSDPDWGGATLASLLASSRPAAATASAAPAGSRTAPARR
jgi:very-short-patch-repair endonuclease